jgi:hypothetical protein
MTEYKLHGSKRQGERVDRVVLEGSSVDPVRSIETGGESVELSEEEVTRLRASGLDIRKVSSSGDDEPEEQQVEPQTAPPEARRSRPSNPPS